MKITFTSFAEAVSRLNEDWGYYYSFPDPTKEDRLTFKELYQHRYFQKDIPVTPDLGGFWMNNEFHAYNHQRRMCEICGKTYAAHYTSEWLCMTHQIQWNRLRNRVWALNQKEWYEATYPKKPITLEPKQLTLFK